MRLCGRLGFQTAFSNGSRGLLFLYLKVRYAADTRCFL
nr:MAG TPA: hypothetical protein [Caudoviricetes sp.]